jgi:hypothetical protein
VNGDALVSLGGADGQVDTAARQRVAAQFRALPIAQQEAVAAALSTRVEREFAAISGLAAAAGGVDVVLAALAAAGEQLKARALAATAQITARPTAARPLAEVWNADLGRGRFLHVVDTPTPTPVDITVGVGLFQAQQSLGTAGAAVIDTDKYPESGQAEIPSGEGSKSSISIQSSTNEITYKGQHEGVDIEYLVRMLAHPCPEPDGSFLVDAKIDVKAGKGGISQNATMDIKITGTVDDDAELASQHMEFRTQWSSSAGGRGKFLDITTSGPNGVEQTTVNRSRGEVTGKFTDDATGATYFVAGLASRFLLAATEKAWKSGRCVLLNIKPSDGPGGLEVSQVVSALAQPRSKIDGQATGGKVRATLSSGTSSVEPSDSPIPADALFRYTAPDEQKQSGTVSFESRSRRGVGKADVRFSTRRPAAYRVQGGFGEERFDTKVCDVTVPFTIKGSVFTMKFTPAGDAAGAAVATGRTGGATFSSRGTYDINLPDGFGRNGTMTASMSTTVVIPRGGSMSQRQAVRFKLTALDPDEC